MRNYFLLALLALLLPGPVRPAAAQDLTIDRLLSLTALPTGTSADMGDWTFSPATSQAAEEKLTWGWEPDFSSDTGRVLLLQLSLRPAPQGYDVVLYIQRLPVYNQLRRELEKKRFVAAPVTCITPGCLGFRYTLETATVAFYEGKSGDYPFVVVVQPKAGRPALPPVPGARPQTVKTKAKSKAAAAVPPSEPASAQP